MQFCAQFQIITGKVLNVHLILDDPAGNSYVQVSTLILPPYYTLSRKFKTMNREEENREESVFFGALDQKTTVLESKPRR